MTRKAKAVRKREVAEAAQHPRPGKSKQIKASTSEKASKDPSSASKTGKPDMADAGRMMRDTFRMPLADFDLLRRLKARARSLGRPCKKSDLLRAGLHAIERFDDLELLTALPEQRPRRRK